MVRAGYEAAAEKQLGANVMERSRHLHRLPLPELCRAALQTDGRDIPTGREQMIRAAVSNGIMPVALGNTANKVLVMAYQQAPASWRSFAATKSCKNFKANTGIRPTFAVGLEKVGAGGEVKHGSFNEETYSWAIDTYAKQLKITRTDFINDDLGAFSEVLPSMGRAAARTLNNLVATTVLSNLDRASAAFWTTGNANYFEGAATNLQASSLATAIKKLRDMVDNEGNLLDLEPAALVVPSDLENTARGLIESAEIFRTTNGLPTGNAMKNVASPAVEPRLGNSAFTGYSATGWYLFSASANSSVIVVGFLDSQEAPSVETFGLDSDINSLAFGFRIVHDFGCALADQRTSARSKGAA